MSVDSSNNSDVRLFTVVFEFHHNVKIYYTIFYPGKKHFHSNKHFAQNLTKSELSLYIYQIFQFIIFKYNEAGIMILIV